MTSAGYRQASYVGSMPIILESIVGSTACGLAVEGSDEDRMGVCLEGLAEAVPLGRPPFEHRVEEKPDRTIYGLRKFLRLAIGGNPTLLGLFFIQPETATAIGTALVCLRSLVVSKTAGPHFLGYMQGQRQRLMGERGQKRIKRPELEAMHGYDTKYAMHVLRLGLHGIELMTTGQMSFPMQPADRARCLALRRGEVPFEDCLRQLADIEHELKQAIAQSSIRPTADVETIEQWLHRTYLTAWTHPKEPLCHSPTPNGNV
jgi:predicted nucleotidyltransferase